MGRFWCGCFLPLDFVVTPARFLRPTQVPSIQQTAALALGRLANYSDDLAEAVVANEILPQLVYSLGEQNVRSLPCASGAAVPPCCALCALL